ncbi:MAG: class I SAM-dependent methyltransferase [Myxococcota bacterium]
MIRDETRLGLLDELDGALERVPALEPLCETRFLETHVLYEGRSDQQRRIIEWFGQNMGPAGGADRAFRVLSVGCGSGILDVPLAVRFASGAPALHYVGVDPNQAECNAFVRRFESADLPDEASLTVEASPFEDFDAEGRFDLVHLVHCLYYLQDPEAVIAKARRLLAPGGSLVLVHAPRGHLNDLSTRFYDKGYGRPTWFADDCAGMLEDLGWAYDRSRIDAQVDVTPFAERDPVVGLALRDFIVQFDSLKLPLEVQGMVDRYLDLIAFRDAKGTVFIDHPADVFVIAES